MDTDNSVLYQSCCHGTHSTCLSAHRLDVSTKSSSQCAVPVVHGDSNMVCTVLFNSSANTAVVWRSLHNLPVHLHPGTLSSSPPSCMACLPSQRIHGNLCLHKHSSMLYPCCHCLLSAADAHNNEEAIALQLWPAHRRHHDNLLLLHALCCCMGIISHV